MKVMRVLCESCAGMGKESNWKIIHSNDQTSALASEEEKTVCDVCNGKGYTEYVIFSMEEAKAILKYCGLTPKIDK